MTSKRVRNSKGINQYASGVGQGSRTKQIGLRISEELDAAIRDAAEEEGVSLTEWAEKAFTLALQARRVKPSL